MDEKKKRTTTRKVKVVGTQEYINKTTGEVEQMQVISMEDRDFDFHKVWLKSILYTFDLIGNKKIKCAMWIINHLDSENKLLYSIRSIARESGISVSTVQETIKALQESDFLQQIPTCRGAYRVNPNILFKGGHLKRMNVLLEYQKTPKVVEGDFTPKKKTASKGAASIKKAD